MLSSNRSTLTFCDLLWHCDHVDNCCVHRCCVDVASLIFFSTYQVATRRAAISLRRRRSLARRVSGSLFLILYCSAGIRYNSNDRCCSYNSKIFYALLPPSCSSPLLYICKSKFVISADILGSPAIVFNFVFLGGGLLGRGVNKFLYSLYYCIVNKDEVV